MKKYLLVLFALFIVPCSGWSHEIIKEELKLIVEEIQSLVKKEEYSRAPIIIAIGGCPGVGKSTITKLLQAELLELGVVSAIISQDHYGLSQSERTQFSSELDPRRIQWNKLHSTLTSIRNGENEVVKPTINQLTKEMGQETLQLANVDCVLFEGAYTLCDFPPMDFLHYADLAIYLESSLENIYDWKWEREFKKSLQRSPESFFNHMMEILRDFAFHVYPTKKNADCVVQIDFFHHYSTIDNKMMKVRPEPDFRPLRLETLTY